MNSSSPRDVHRFLRSRKFKLVAPAPGTVASYEGTLGFRGTPIPARLDIIDWNFRTQPQIRLLQRPPALSGFRPHLGLGATVCYLDRESVHMDIYDPVRVVARCLLEAESTLEDIAGSKERIDVQGEFLANWLPHTQFPLMLWTPHTQRRALSVVGVDFLHKPGTFVVTDSPKKTRDALVASGHKIADMVVDCVTEFSTSVPPAFDPDQWPVARLRDLVKWVEQWDVDLHRAFFGRLESMWSKDRTVLVAVFSTPSGRFGCQFEIKYRDQSERKRLSKHPSDRRQRMLSLNPRLTRFTVSDLSPDFVHGRNQNARETLRDKRIALVGCGAVGGYLATFLARLGAGLGNGELVLFDPQRLGPENLGRHVLSISDLYRNKADGVASLLTREFQHLRVRARAIDAIDAEDLFDSHVVIDASGSSSTSSALNARHLRIPTNSESRPAVVYAWVEGPGDAARCLVVDSPKFMCYECQFLRPVDAPTRDRFPVSKRSLSSGREHPGNCNSYMPFAVSAAVTTAALALDAVRDTVKGTPHPRLRIRRLATEFTQAREDVSPEPLQSCPACRSR